MKPSEMTHHSKIAAAKAYYPQCLKYIEENMKPQFRQLAKATLMYYLPRAILDLSTKEERRAAIDSIPDDLDITHFKPIVKLSVRSLWESDQRRARANQAK